MYNLRATNMLKAFFITLLISVIFLFSVVLNLDKPIELAHSDTFHVILTLKHYMNTVLNGSWANVFNVPIFYGFPYTLLYSELFIVEAIVTLPFYVIFKDIVIAYNIVSFLTIWASLLAMFCLANYLSKSFWGAILGAIIYVFNPFVIGHFPDNLHYYSLYFIPLIFLFLEKFLVSKKGTDAFLVGLFLTLQLLTSITFGALLTVILPVYALIRLVQTKFVQNTKDLKKFLSIGAIAGLLILFSTAIGINRLYNIYFTEQSLGRNLAETAVFSPWVSDLFLTAPNNLMYGGLRGWSRDNLPYFFFTHPEYIERNLFFGLSVWVLLIASFWLVRKNEDSRHLWTASLTIIVFATLLSFGPRIRLTADFSLPGIYGLIHQFHPLLQNLRVASRFMIFVFLFLGLISAFCLANLQNCFKGQRKLFISLLIILAVSLEYYSTPWKYALIPEETKAMYAAIESDRDIKVLLEYPMGNLFSRIGLAHNQFVETQYMLYASTLHSKNLLNGYSSYTPVRYPSRIEYLTVNFPNPIKLNQLKKWGVDAIVLHKNEFNTEGDYGRIKSQLELLNLAKIYESADLTSFKLASF